MLMIAEQVYTGIVPVGNISVRQMIKKQPNPRAPRIWTRYFDCGTRGREHIADSYIQREMNYYNEINCLD